MNIILFILYILLFFIFVPDIIIPLKTNKHAQCLIHAIVFSIVLLLLTKQL